MRAVFAIVEAILWFLATATILAICGCDGEPLPNELSAELVAAPAAPVVAGAGCADAPGDGDSAVFAGGACLLVRAGQVLEIGGGPCWPPHFTDGVCWTTKPGQVIRFANDGAGPSWALLGPHAQLCWGENEDGSPDVCAENPSSSLVSVGVGRTHALTSKIIDR